MRIIAGIKIVANGAKGDKGKLVSFCQGQVGGGGAGVSRHHAGIVEECSQEGNQGDSAAALFAVWQVAQVKAKDALVNTNPKQPHVWLSYLSAWGGQLGPRRTPHIP